MKKQCPICGEYIENDVEICPFCNEKIITNNKSEKPELVKDSSKDESKEDTITEKEPSKSGINLNIIVVVSSLFFVFIVLLCSYFLFSRFNNISRDKHVSANNEEIEVSPKQLSNRMDEARKYFQDKQYEKAAQICEEEIDKNQNPIAYFYLGRIYQEQDYIDLAIENLKKAANSKPDLFEAQLELAKIYYNKGEYDSALEYFNAANKLKANNKEVLESLVDIYYKQENIEKSIEFSKQLIKLDSNNYQANIVLCIEAMRRDDIGSSIKYLKKSLDINYNVGDAILLAKMYMQKEQYTNAISVLDKIIDDDYYNYEAKELKAKAINLREDYKLRQEYKQIQQNLEKNKIENELIYN